MIRPARPADHAGILALYRDVAAIPGGIARTPDEVTDGYIAGFMHRAAEHGLEFVYEEGGRILGEIHASNPGIACFAHLLTDLTVAVAPSAQGGGIGRKLFQALLGEVLERRPQISRVELFARASNARARSLYASVGFVEEGRLRARIATGGLLEEDTIMAWLRP